MLHELKNVLCALISLSSSVTRVTSGGGLVGLVTPGHDRMTTVTGAISYYYNKAVVGLLLLLQFCFDKKMCSTQKNCVQFCFGWLLQLAQLCPSRGPQAQGVMATLLE